MVTSDLLLSTRGNIFDGILLPTFFLFILFFFFVLPAIQELLLLHLYYSLFLFISSCPLICLVSSFPPTSCPFIFFQSTTPLSSGIFGFVPSILLHKPASKSPKNAPLLSLFFLDFFSPFTPTSSSHVGTAVGNRVAGITVLLF